MKFAALILTLASGIGLAGWRLCFRSDASCTGIPALERQWNNEVYGLDENEVLRFVSPPFPSQHINQVSSFGSFASDESQLNFSMGNGQVSSISASYGSLHSAIVACAENSRFRIADYEIEYDVASIAMHGDWIISIDAPIEHRMQALESILTHVTGQRLIIEKRPALRDVIAIRGKCKFQPDAPGSLHQTLYLYERPENLKQEYRRAEDFCVGASSLFQDLEWYTHAHLVDETVRGIPANLVYIDFIPRFWCGNQSPPDSELILANISRQTALQFVETKRPVPVWFVKLRKD